MIKKRMATRRNFIWGLGALVGASAVASEQSTNLKNLFHQSRYRSRDFSVIGDASLQERATDRGLIYGAAGDYLPLSSNEDYAAAFVRECGLLVSGELKWNYIRPKPDSFDFSKSDWVANFARSHRLLFRGHTLVWNVSLPDWFEETVNRNNAEQFMVKHIETVVGHYAGQMHSWDVVNEAIEPYDKRSDGLRKTPWLKFLGPDYIDLAFRVAAETDPQALLVYNDYGLDYDHPKDEARRTAVLKLLERLKSQGTPVHALGIQAHLWGDAIHFNPKKLRNFLSQVASLDLKILITELDVVDKKLPADIEVRDRIVAGVYEDYLSVVLDEPAVIAVITWGLSDRYNWISEFHPRSDGLPVRPFPLDADFQPKLAWNGIARAFDFAPRR
jgi:endo-1,4-beta-xylanase